MHASKAKSTSVQLPDLPKICSAFDLDVSKHCRPTTLSSQKWLVEAGLPPHWRTTNGCTWKALKVGLWASVCFPRADPMQLRLAMDFMSLLVWSTEVGQEGDVFALLSDRMSRVAYRSPAWYLRFINSLRAYREARAQVAEDAQNGSVPDMESYIQLRRDASGLRLVLAFIECTMDLRLPENVASHPVVQALTEHAIDIIAWSEDLAMLSRNQASGHTFHLPAVIMAEQGLTLPGAVTQCGTLIRQAVEAFLATEQDLPSFEDPQVDREVRSYVRGLRECIAGSINWMYESQRYFGDRPEDVRNLRWVFVGPGSQ